ncbi:MAG: fibronectin type III domain-containing protein [Armatimonadota bacterium]
MNQLPCARRRLLYAFATVLLLGWLSCIVYSATLTPFQVFSKGKNVQVRQRFGQWLMITEDLTDGRVCYFYDPIMRTKLNLKSALPGDWTPLGSAIKWLMYVDNVQQLDRLISHDVDSQAWHITKSSTLRQVGCGMAGNTCVFGEYRANPIGGITPVDLYTADVGTGAIAAFCSSDSEKSEFAHDGNLIVYKARYPSGFTGIYGHYFQGNGEFLITECEASEPSVCGSLVAWAQRSGAGWNIIARDISSGETRTIAYTTADLPRPEAGRNTIFWEDARNLGSTGIDIYGYDWRTSEEFVVTNATGNQARLRVCDDLVTWVSGPTNYEVLWAARIQSPSYMADLKPEQIGDSFVKLAWTAIGTTSNPVVSYEVRTSDQSPIGADNWDQASTVSVLTTSATSGQRVSVDLQGLESGHHYFAVRAMFADGGYSAVSNCVRVYLPRTPNDALRAEAGAYVGFDGTVTGVSPDMGFYLRQTSGMLAVRVIPSAQQTSVAIGDLVSATGMLTQDDQFHGPVIRQAHITSQTSGNSVRRMAMTNKALGGSIAGLPGAPNVWLPVKTWGRVSTLTLSNGCSFIINDGSVPGGVRVVSPFAPPGELADGCFACIEGICRVSRVDGREVEVVDNGGIQICQQTEN